MAVKKTDTEVNFPFNSKKARAITESYSRARDMHALPRFLQSTKTSRSLVVDSSTFSHELRFENSLDA